MVVSWLFISHTTFFQLENGMVSPSLMCYLAIGVLLVAVLAPPPMYESTEPMWYPLFSTILLFHFLLKVNSDIRLMTIF